MKTREQTARFIETQMHWTHQCKREKGNYTHYGFQELRELLDFIYEAEPLTEKEQITRLPPK